MSENLEVKLAEFKQTMESIKKYKQSSKLAPHGERILQLIQEGDYSEAKFITRCLIECALTERFDKEILSKVEDYLNSAYALATNLPRQEYVKARDSWED